MKKFVKRHKGLCIGLSIFLVLAILIGSFISKTIKATTAVMEVMMRSEAVEVERRDLVSSVPATGTVISVAKKSVKAEMNGVKVLDVFVQVGDQVEAGQLLCALDSSSVEENLDIAEKNQKVSNQSSSISLASAKRQLADAQEAQAYSVQQYNDQLKDLEKNRNSAEEELKKYTNSYNNAVNKRKDLEKKIDDAKKRIAEIDARLVAIQAELALLPPVATPAPVEPSPAPADPTPIPETTPAPLDEKPAPETTPSPVEETPAPETTPAPVDANPEPSEEQAMDVEGDRRQILEAEAAALNQEKEILTTAIPGWTAELNVAKAEEQTAYDLYIAKVNVLETAKNSYESAIKTGEHTAKTYASQLAGARDNLTNVSGNLSVSDLNTKQQIEKYKEQIESCNVYAPISGVITEVLVEKGDSYMGSPVATIEDISGFEIQTYINEYEIGKIREGQEVVIKTNGTGALEIKGTVKSISPRAVQNMGGGTVAYGVIVSIDEKVEGIRMDMTAKMSIILEKAENTITVPFESVQEETDGRKYVEVQTGEIGENGQKKTKKVYVTTGLESDYYIEIVSGDLEEGAKVVIPRKEFTAMDINALLEEEGVLGGY